jgi:hypothetical protein
MTVKTKTAEALFPVLSVFHSVGDQSLQAVWQRFTQGCLEQLILSFGSISLVVTVDKDDDSIELRSERGTDTTNLIEMTQSEPWKIFVGKSFGWGWVTINQQGYCDGLLLSFEGAVPQLVLNVAASSIKIGMVTEISH